MDIPFLCIFLAFLLNYITDIPVAIARIKRPEGFNNYSPRAQQAELTGWGRRALGAHLNSFEAFPAFAAAVLVAHMAGVNEKHLTSLCIAFVILRLCHLFFYLLNFSSLRSLVWFASTICIGTIFVLAIF